MQRQGLKDMWPRVLLKPARKLNRAQRQHASIQADWECMHGVAFST